MPIKIDGYRNVCAQKSCSKQLKNEISKNKQVVCRGNNMFKNSKFHPIHILTLKLLEKTESIIKSYPKIGEKILTLSEKILKNADSLK